MPVLPPSRPLSSNWSREPTGGVVAGCPKTSRSATAPIAERRSPPCHLKSRTRKQWPSVGASTPVSHLSAMEPIDRSERRVNRTLPLRQATGDDLAKPQSTSQSPVQWVGAVISRTIERWLRETWGSLFSRPPVSSLGSQPPQPDTGPMRQAVVALSKHFYVARLLVVGRQHSPRGDAHARAIDNARILDRRLAATRDHFPSGRQSVFGGSAQEVKP
jgi:hypothetical protein